ncbi:MAG: Ku protein, partial [Thermomicrobiales bacterium]
SVRFRLLHDKDLEPVSQQMVDPRNNKPVPPDEIKRGVEVEKGVFVVITDDEQEDLEPAESREITLGQVLDRSCIEQRWFDHPYYLGPDGDSERYFALAEALSDKNQLAVAHWTMRKKRYNGALHATGGYLMLETLRSTEELLQIDPVKTPPSRAPDKRELDLAEQLVTGLQDEFDPAQWRDEYREQVLELIDLKIRGKVVKFPKEKPPKSGGSLIDSLEASLKQGGKRSRASKA